MAFLVCFISQAKSVLAKEEAVLPGGFISPNNTTIIFKPESYLSTERKLGSAFRKEKAEKFIARNGLRIANAADILWIGDQHRFTVISGENDNGKVCWYSSNPDVATIDRKTGELTAVGRGRTKITVIGGHGIKKDSYVLTVISPKTYVEVQNDWTGEQRTYLAIAKGIENLICEQDGGNIQQVNALHLRDGIKALSDCFGSNELKCVRIPASVKYIGCTMADSDYFGIDHASQVQFVVDGNNPHYYSLMGSLFAYPFIADSNPPDMEVQSGCTMLLAYADKADREVYYVPYGVEKIGAKAFMKTKYLKKVVIPPTVTTIGAAAFQMCDGIEEIIIPSSVTRFEEYDGDEYYSSFGSMGYQSNETWYSADTLTLKTLTIITPKGSAAEAYAIEHGIKYRNE